MRLPTVAFVAIVTAAVTVAAAAAFASERGAAIDSALTRPPKDALRIIDSLSRAGSADTRTRAMSMRLLGDHRFVREDYKNAAEFYRQALRLDSLLAYKHLYALAIAMDGQTSAAMDIWASVAKDTANPLGAEAAAILAQLSASAGRQAAPVNQQVAPAADGRQPANPPPADGKPAARQPPNIIFTVQVGAFGSKDNADSMVRRLSGTYDDITVSPTVSGEQTLYRVRVGTFATREEATVFADRLLTTAGMSARVVEKY